MKGLAASRPSATISSVGACAPRSLTRVQESGVASASTIMMATSSPTTRPATAMLNTAPLSWECFGNATHWRVPEPSSMRAIRTPPMGPENGRPDSCVDREAALMATVS